jgi:uncharacterized OB-fold protein
MTSNDSGVSPNRDVAPQWRSTNGKLLIQRCDECGDPFYYPRIMCPFCLSPKVRWLECSGHGRIYSYSVVRRGEPYAIAFVTLEEGPKMMTNIVDCAFDRIAVNQPVSVVFRDIEGVPTPMFRPSGAP